MATEGTVLSIPEGKDIFKYLAEVLPEHCEKETLSQLFIVEGTKENPRIGIRYPGHKLKKRALKRANKNSALWGNLLDFLVVPFINGKEQEPNLFHYRNILEDFEKYKKDSNEFWEIIMKLHKQNILTKEPPKLEGIESRLFLEMLKWLWIQEDLNYRLSHAAVESKIKYILLTKGGSPTSGGAGRDKFYAALNLVRSGDFNSNLAAKICL